MYLLNAEFARRQGSKDKKQRLKRGLQIAGGLAATGLLAGVAIKNKNKIKQVFTKQTTQTKPKLLAATKTNKKAENANRVKSKLQEIKEKITDPEVKNTIGSKPNRQQQKKQRSEIKDFLKVVR